MSLKLTLAAAGFAALLSPMAASAQSWDGDQYRGPQQQSFVAPTSQDDWQGYHRYGDRGEERSDWQDRRGGDYYRGSLPSWFRGFPEFAGVRDHLKQEIREGRREGWLSEERAQRFVDRYRDVERDEYREFREHGWNLPERERDQFRQRLADLDQRLDQARDRRY